MTSIRSDGFDVWPDNYDHTITPKNLSSSLRNNGVPRVHFYESFVCDNKAFIMYSWTYLCIAEFCSIDWHFQEREN